MYKRRNKMVIICIEPLECLINWNLLKSLSSFNNKTNTTFVLRRFSRLSWAWPVDSRSSFSPFSRFFASSHFNAHSLMSLSTIWYHVIFDLPLPPSHLPLHSHHHLSVTHVTHAYVSHVTDASSLTYRNILCTTELEITNLTYVP